MAQFKMIDQKKYKQKFWYQIIVWMCPVCGSEQKFKERVYKKPENNYIVEDHYDWCLERC